MDVKSTKIELAKLILDIEDPRLIKKIRDMLTAEKSDFWTSLSEHEKKEIRLGIKQLEEGKKITVDEFIKKVS